jgi:hypothetical protein
MSRKIFSEKEDIVLKKLYSTLTNKELVQVFNGQFSIKQIKYRGKTLKLNKTSDIKSKALSTRTGCWEEWEIEIVKRHFSLDGAEGCQKYLQHRSIPSIKHKAYRLNIHLKNPNHANGPKQHSLESRQKMSNSSKGKKFSAQHLENLRKSFLSGEKHPNWKSGRSFKDYGPEFNTKLKQKIKGRDKFICQRCDEKKSWKRLIVHHIDYNKTNNTEINLISLCIDCHTKHHLKLSEENKLKEQELFRTILGEKNNVVNQ